MFIKKDMMISSIGNILEDVEKINGVSVIAKKYEDADVNDLRNIIDDIKTKTEKTVIVFASNNSGKVMFIVAVTDDLLDQGYHAGNIIKEVAKAAGGGGGGKANMAQAGGKDASKIDDAFQVAKDIVRISESFPKCQYIVFSTDYDEKLKSLKNSFMGNAIKVEV